MEGDVVSLETLKAANVVRKDIHVLVSYFLVKLLVHSLFKVLLLTKGAKAAVEAGWR